MSSSETRRSAALTLAERAGFATDFVGYETTDRETTIGASAAENGEVLIKLVESPFYATGGGQVADSGYVECLNGDCRARVEDVVRLGDDQVVVVLPERGTIEPGERVRAHVDWAARHATACNHTATHLLDAALRRRLGTHVHQAGSYVGPDKLRFDFSHGQGLSPEELQDVEDQVNLWILEAQPVRALTTTLTEAKRLGAMALFGEKYGEVVRLIEIGDEGGGGGRGDSISRELCGGTHVANTAEIGLFKVLGESSIAANMRRIEAITGPEAVGLMRRHDRELADAAKALRTRPERVAAEVAELRSRVRELERAERREASEPAVDVEQLAAAALERGGARVLVTELPGLDGKALLDVADRIRNALGDAAIVLGSSGENRVDLVASVAPALVERGVKAGELVKLAAAEVGGGGGGRDTLARAGGRDPSGLSRAFEVALTAIESALSK